LTADGPVVSEDVQRQGGGPPSLLFFLVVTLVLPCFGGGILENGTETQTQEQYSTINNIKDEIIFGTKRAGATWLHSFSEQESWIQLVRG
jgi:hypothetical protein